jgi:perosamine synthetase
MNADVKQIPASDVQVPEALLMAAPRPASAVPLGPADYPLARVPVAPVLSTSSFRRLDGRKVSSILDVGATLFLTSGRCAIAMALKQMNIGPGDSVLVPAYHCASMIEPVIWAGATPVFYRINPDTSVNLEDVAAKLDGSTRLLLAANYFGFPQNLSAIRTFCDTHGMQLLEDCAHCFLGEYNGKPVGSFGDYAIASSMKFFPIYEGGCLVSAKHDLKDVELQSGGLGFEAKVAFNALEISFNYKRLGWLKALLSLPMFLKNFLWSRIKASRSESKSSLAPGSSEGGFGFDPAWINKRSSYFSRLVMDLSSRRRIGALRRQNYMKLSNAVVNLPHCRPLFQSLPEHVYPWVFPLLTDNPKPVFDILKMQGVPIVRFGEYLWPGIDATVCESSVDLSQRVLSFSCHQELRDEEIEWMINKIKDALLSECAPKL